MCMEPTETLYETLVKNGIEVSNHYSDLYFERTPASVEILNKFELFKKNATTFKNQITGTYWYDVPFAFDPYWESKIN